MNEIISRIKEIRKINNLSQTTFGEKMGVSRDVIKNIELEIVPLKEHFIKLICSTFNVNENWLRTGNGNMFSSTPYERELLNVFDCLSPVSQEYLIQIAQGLLQTQEKLLNKDSE